jgi:hypothetical protein
MAQTTEPDSSKADTERSATNAPPGLTLNTGDRPMTKATSTSTSPRRGMLAGTAAALLGAVSLASGRSAAAGESQDSELRILCAEFHRTQAELDRWHATGFRLEPLGRKTEAYRLWEAENARFFWANHDAFEAVRDMPAKTQAGIIAKSKVLAEQMDRVMVKLDGSMCGASNYEIFAYKLVQNTMRIGGGAA